MRSLVIALLTGLALTIATPFAGAKPKAKPMDPNKAQALEHYNSATAHYDKGEFKEAIADYREAYLLHPDPVFLFNIAQSYRQMNEYALAIQFYKSFLRDKPDSDSRDEIEGHIAEMQKKLDAAPVKPEPKPVVKPEPKPALVPVVPKPVAKPEPIKPAPKPVKPIVASTPKAAAKIADQDTTPPPVDEGGGGKKGGVLGKWWFWTAIGAVVVGGVVVGVAASGGSSGGFSPPSSSLGHQKAF